MPALSSRAETETRRIPREPCSELAIARLVGRQLVCRISNRTALGLRLSFGAPPRLDPLFVIQVAETKSSMQVRVVWQTGSEVGVCSAQDPRPAEGRAVSGEATASGRRA